MIARRWSQIVLAAAAIAFVLATRAAISGEDDLTTITVLVVAGLATLAIGVGILAARALLPRTRALGAGHTAALTVAIALLAATPVDFAYDDGCNDHDTVAPLALVPVLGLTRPERADGAYVDWSTLMACFDAGDRLPPPLPQ